MTERSASTLDLCSRFVVFVLSALLSGAVFGQADDFPRTASGKPDFSGFYNVATLTPLERPPQFGDQLLLTREEAAAIEQAELERREQRGLPSQADREAPPEGGDGSPGAYGNVGGYNYFWLDLGTEVFELDGKFRTSIITSPKNGRKPPLTEVGERKTRARAALFPNNEGFAFWLDQEGPGPYDDIEQRPLAERCLLGFSSTAGPPMMPAGYNNLKRIVQTDSAVVLLTEMVHDARIVRIDAEHGSGAVRHWLGESTARWDGDTLVVETRNFGDRPALFPASSRLEVTERFSPLDRDHLLYQFEVRDPSIWTSSWSGEYVWPRSPDKLFEYACHEGNYALGNILRGARLLESERRGSGAP